MSTNAAGNPKLRAMPEGVARSACKLAMKDNEEAIRKYAQYNEDSKRILETYTGSWRGFKRGERYEQ